jgi:glycosyltransferase involved in cell wall biosynthesis
MIGGAQSLYNVFSCITGPYAILTSREALLGSLAYSRLRGPSLPCPYYAIEGGRFEPPSISETPPAPAYPARMVTLIRAVTRTTAVGRQSVRLAVMVRGVAKYLRGGRKAIVAEHSELLVGISDGGTALISTWLLSLVSRRPYALYLFDLYRGNNLLQPGRLLARLFEGSIVTRAKKVIVTNEATEQYYQRRYPGRIRTAVVHNSVRERHVTEDYAPHPPFTIVFTGNVYWAQLHSVLNLIKAAKLLSDLPLNIRLYVTDAAPELVEAVRGQPRITMAAAHQSEMPRIQSEATLLFLPLAWHTQSPDIISTATPGKFTDYLASGRPMLIHAPDYAFVSRHARQHQLGLVVDQDSPELLAAAILEFLQHPEQGKTYVKNALAMFQQDYEAGKNARVLAEILNEIQT